MNKTLGFGCLAIALLSLFVFGMGGCTVYKGYNNLVTLGEGVIMFCNSRLSRPASGRRGLPSAV